MQFTIFHAIVFILLLLCFVLICVLIFFKVKQKEIALISYTITAIFTAILMYSIFMLINDFTTQASLSKLTYTRNLRQEGLIVSARVENLTRFRIRKCYLMLNILNRKQVGGEIFENQNLKNAKIQNTSVSYTIEITNDLPGKTYRDFSVQVPFPPSFSDPEFYHTLKCI